MLNYLLSPSLECTLQFGDLFSGIYYWGGGVFCVAGIIWVLDHLVAKNNLQELRELCIPIEFDQSKLRIKKSQQ